VKLALAGEGFQNQHLERAGRNLVAGSHNIDYLCQRV
jgi:hypothetical protein